MKKLFLLWGIMLLPILANGQIVEIDGIWYSLSSNNNKYAAWVIRNEGDTNYMGEIVIPKSIIVDDVLYNVTGIDYDAFYYCRELKSVTIPNSVTGISGATRYDVKKAGAFEGCTNLINVTIPNSVKHIGDRVFYGCEQLQNITLPDSLTYIGSSVFSGCIGLTNIVIPNSVKRIYSNTFEYCTV